MPEAVARPGGCSLGREPLVERVRGGGHWPAPGVMAWLPVSVTYTLRGHGSEL